MSLSDEIAMLRAEHEKLGLLLASGDGEASWLAALGASVERMAAIVGAHRLTTSPARPDYTVCIPCTNGDHGKCRGAPGQYREGKCACCYPLKTDVQSKQGVAHEPPG